MRIRTGRWSTWSSRSTSAAILRGLPAGPRFQRGARPYLAHLRHRPVADMTSAFNAMEDALGVEVARVISSAATPLYCGEWSKPTPSTSSCFMRLTSWASKRLGRGRRAPRGGRGRGCGSRPWATSCLGRSAAVRSIRSTFASAGSTRRQAKQTWTRWSQASRRPASWRASRWPGSRAGLPRLRPGLRVRRAAPPGSLCD